MIEFERIQKRYGATTAIRDLSLVVEQGETLALVGPNGAGKTTLIRVLLGLVRPTAGVVRVAGFDVQREGVNARRNLGYLPQRALLYTNLTVAENVAFLARLRDVPLTRVDAVLELLHLREVADRTARTLSGGMLQRLGLAQALLADPPILVFDEPTVSLDPSSVAVFKALLRELHAAGKTLLLSSHILSDVQVLADRVAILDQGVLVALDSVAGLAERCALPEQLLVDLATVTGHEADVARAAGAATVEWRGPTLALGLPRERKLAVLAALIDGGAAIRDFRSEAPTLEAIFSHLVKPAGGG